MNFANARARIYVSATLLNNSFGRFHPVGISARPDGLHGVYERFQVKLDSLAILLRVSHQWPPIIADNVVNDRLLLQH